MATEHQRIERIRALLAPSSTAGPAARKPSGIAAGIEVGIGDDCAVLAQASGARVWTVDSAVQGVHFRRDCMSLDAIGFRSFMAAASDIAAMGAKALAALSALVLPASLTDAELDQLVGGIARAADVCACPVIGGNLARGSDLSVTTTLLGEPHQRAVLRSSAREGDGLFVTGKIGGAALGMHALFAGRQDPAIQPCIDAFLAPRARLDVSEALGHIASSAIDISDGLLQDARHLCRASQLSARIELARIPRLAELESLAHTLKLDFVPTLVAGGEDYELLFTAAVDADVSAWATRIGVMKVGASNVFLVDADGSLLSVSAGGFDHFG